MSLVDLQECTSSIFELEDYYTELTEISDWTTDVIMTQISLNTYRLASIVDSCSGSINEAEAIGTWFANAASDWEGVVAQVYKNRNEFMHYFLGFVFALISSEYEYAGQNLARIFEIAMGEVYGELPAALDYCSVLASMF